MKKANVWTSLSAALIATSAAAAPVELTLDVNGALRMGDTGARMEMMIHREGWRDVTHGVCSSYNGLNEKTGTAAVHFYRDRDNVAKGSMTALTTADKRAVLSASVTSINEKSPEKFLISLTLPIEYFGDIKWKTSSERSGTVPVQWNGHTAGFFHGVVSWLDITPANGEAFRLTFPTGAFVNMQDNRTWKYNDVSVRIYSEGEGPFSKGCQRAISMIVSAVDGVNVNVEKPVVIKAGKEWVALDYCKDIEEGSALDFSNQGMQDAPAGKHGWLKNVDGHFEFENLPGKKQRFYGGNLSFDANFPDRDFADRLVTRFVRLGYNAIRIHHYESDKGVVKDSPDLLTLNEERMDKLDYFLAKCFEKGIYATSDFFTSRPVTWRMIGIERDGVIPPQVFKNMVLVHEGAYKNFETFQRNILTHVNKYTNRAYKDEPALPIFSVINEGKLFSCWKSIKNEDAMKKAWKKWIDGKRATNPDYAKGISDDSALVEKSQCGAVIEFMADLERSFFKRQRAFFKEMGVKALLTNQNCGMHYTPMMAAREELYDYVDDHFYVDHPEFLGNDWRLPSRCENKNPVLLKSFNLLGKSFTRVASKPFVITEWNFSGPGMYRGMGGIMTGAYSALQDWSGLWRFAYSHSLDGMKNGVGRPGFFDTASDPLGQAGDRASVCLFLRGDLAPLSEMAVSQITDESFVLPGGNSPDPCPAWNEMTWQVRAATAYKETCGHKAFDFMTHRNKKTLPIEVRENEAIALDRERGTFRIVTEKTAGAFVPSGAIEAGAIAFEASDTPTTVWASSLDGKAICESKRIVVTHLTDVQADGNVYADKERRTLLKWGKSPPLVRVGSAKVSLKLAEPDKYTVWALASSGKRLEKIPCEAKDGRLNFTVSVKGPHGARMSYEVVAEK